MPETPPGNASGHRNMRPALLGLAGLAVAATVVWTVIDKIGTRTGTNAPGDITGAVSDAPIQRGPSGLPLPRFVSLKSEKVNVRRGPSSDYPVSWVFQRKGMPVEITAEFENWRRIRDSEGQEGWILQQMLSGKRTAIAMAYRGNTHVLMRDDKGGASTVIAKLQPGVTGEVEDCDGRWCHMSAGGYDGYVAQESVWGVYPDETLE
jgi:SH3-like domain-containing protein